MTFLALPSLDATARKRGLIGEGTRMDFVNGIHFLIC